MALNETQINAIVDQVVRKLSKELAISRSPCPRPRSRRGPRR